MPDPTPDAPVGASIADVAARAGVSIATVSRALAGRPNVAEATRARVRAAAESLRYTASPHATGLATGRSYALGVLAPSIGRWFFAEVLRGAESVIAPRGYHMSLYALGDERQRAEFFHRLPLRRRVDAVLVTTLALSEAEARALAALDVPVATVGESTRGLPGVRIDDVHGARMAVQHLINLGHRRIGMVDGFSDAPYEGFVPADRSAGFEQAVREAGLEAESAGLRATGGFTVAGGERAMAELLAARGGPPTAVFCHSDEMAFGALRAIQRVGLRCPEDVSVVGFDGHELADLFDLTTVSQPVQEQGRIAARALLQALDPEAASGARAVLDQRLPLRLVVRGSTAPPRAEVRVVGR